VRNRILRFATYAAVGSITGAIISVVTLVAEKFLLEDILERDLWQKAAAPVVGLWIAILVLRWADRGSPLSPSTSEEYIRSYHSKSQLLRLIHLPFRMLAGIATVGMGGAVGLEGPSIYAGATVGSGIQRKFSWLFGDKGGQALLVAGAAAGVSAIFQAPATGVLFALESPYKGDLGRRALLPSLLSSASSYVTFILMTGLDNELPFDVRTDLVRVGFGSRELLGAVLVGALCGLVAVGFSRVLKKAKEIQKVRPWWVLGLFGGAVAAALVVLCDLVFAAPLSLGPTAEGRLLSWVLNPNESLWLLGLLLVVRVCATSTVIAAGGVGGVFIPLAVFGLIIGRIVGGWVDVGAESLAFFPFIGVAAFLAAGYRTPLTAVMFVAESTGAPSFVVPGLIAVAVSQVVVGNSSVSGFQRDTRTGHLERRFLMPVTSVMQSKFNLVGPDESVSEFVWGVAFPEKQLEALVAGEDRKFLGIIRVADAGEVDRDQWSSLKCADLMIKDIEPARLSWTVREVSAAMEQTHLDIYPVVDTGGRIVGLVTEQGIVNVVELLDETRGN
jgi:CIC family chloride channel protein